MNKVKSIITVLLLCLGVTTVKAQIVGTDAFLFSDGLEIGIHTNGFEGSSALPPFPNHVRGFSPRLGFLSNRLDDGWVNYDGDFFMPGAPECRFGIEVDGVNYWNTSDPFAPASPTPITSLGLSNYQAIGNCRSVDWNGTIAGIDIEMTYKMNIHDYYYTVQVTLTNTNPTDKNDVYFYKSLDPDNNQDIAWGFATQNTIVNQPTEECPKALVTAEDNNGWDSYIGLGALGMDSRVSRGGFYVQSGSDIWNGTGGLVTAMGSSLLSDEAISISHKDETIAAGATSTFEFVVVMDENQITQAIMNLFHFTYEGGPDFETSCSDTSIVWTDDAGTDYVWDGTIDTVYRCTTEPTVLYVEAPGVVISEFNLAWLEEGDTLGTEAYTTIIPGTEPDTAHIICNMWLGGCFGGGTGLHHEYVVITLQSPEIYIDPINDCAEKLALTDIAIIDTAGGTGVPGTFTRYYTYPPTGFYDTGDDLTVGVDSLSNGDTLWVLVGHTETECFDTASVVVNLSEANAGDDNELADLCNTDLFNYDLTLLLSADAHDDGIWEETTMPASGGFDAAMATFSANGVAPGIYTFHYIAGTAPCEPDTAEFKVAVYEPTTAGADAFIDICSAPGVAVDLDTLLSGHDAGGTWASATGLDSFNAGTGVLDASSLSVGMYLFNYTSPASGPCSGDVATITVIISPGPTAYFTFAPGSVFTDDPEVTFANLSTGATSYNWDFGDGSPVISTENPVHNFPGVPYTYNVALTATNDLGCTNTFNADVEVEPITLFFIPNTFTPDGDSYNDTFKPVFESGFDPYNYHLQVYNRYGELLFESYDATKGWDGTYGSQGQIDAGTYTWKIEFKELNSDVRKVYNGHVTILK